MRTIQDLIDNLNQDLQREYQHLHFYIIAATNVVGLHREEISEFFQKQAASELNHVMEFRRLIIGLGGTPTSQPLMPGGFDGPLEVAVLLTAAYNLEMEVVKKYAERLIEAETLQDNGGSDMVEGKYIEIFLEEQLLHSRQDADNIKEMLK